MESITSLSSGNVSIKSLDLRNLEDKPREQDLDWTYWISSDGRTSIRHLYARRNVFYAPHTHSEYTIMVCLEGEVTKTESGETLVIGPGEAMISNIGVEHATGYKSPEGQKCEVICLTFDHHILTSLARDFQLPASKAWNCLAFTGNLKNDIVHNCARNIAKEFRSREAGQKLIVEILAMRLLMEIMRSWSHHQIRTIVADFTPRLRPHDFLRAYEYMRHCRKDTFRLSHLCNFLGISQERFARLFFASTKQTPASFYNRMLLERGCELLREPALLIKEISFELGFKTTSHFIVAFRREFAAAPQEYRERSLRAFSSPACENTSLLSAA